MRSFIVLFALLMGSLLCNAQRPARSGLGYMGGPQAATWQSEAVIYRPVPGFVAGVYAPIWAGSRVEIQPELLLSLQGTTRDLPDGDHSTLRDLRVALPVSLKLFIGRTFNLQAGVQGSLLLLAKTNGTDVKKELGPLDMGVNVGAGIGTISGMDYTLRYYNGLSNVLAEDKSIYPTNHTLQLTVGYRFMKFGRGRRRR